MTANKIRWLLQELSCLSQSPELLPHRGTSIRVTCLVVLLGLFFHISSQDFLEVFHGQTQS